MPKKVKQSKTGGPRHHRPSWRLAKTTDLNVETKRIHIGLDRIFEELDDCIETTARSNREPDGVIRDHCAIVHILALQAARQRLLDPLNRNQNL